MVATILPEPRTVFVDQNGVPLVDGTIDTFIPNTVTPKNTWQNAGQTILNSNPIILDSLGSCLLYGSGQYRFILKDVDGNTIYDAVTASPGTIIGPTSATAGDIAVFSDTSGLILADSGIGTTNGSINYTYSGNGALPWTINGKLDTFATPKDFGALGNGSADDTAAFQLASSNLATSGIFEIPYGNYKINSAITWNSPKVDLTIDPQAAFSGSWLFDLGTFIPNQTTPIYSNKLNTQIYNTSAYGNIFQNATYIKQTGSTPAHAVFGQGESASGGLAWGGRFVGVVSDNTAGGIATALAVNPINNGGTDATAYGIIVAARGTAQAENAIQIQCNDATAEFKDGIMFNGSLNRPVQFALINATPPGSGVIAGRGIDFHDVTFGTYDIRTQNFEVESGDGFFSLPRVPLYGGAGLLQGYFSVKLHGVGYKIPYYAF